jgi:hypothetical protein
MTYVFSSLRVAETVWMEGVFLKEFPPEVNNPHPHPYLLTFCVDNI